MVGESGHTTGEAESGPRLPPPDAVTVTVVIVIAIAAYNVLQNLVLPSWTYAALNMGAAAGVLYIGTRLGLTNADLGIERSRARTGFLVGAAVAVLVVILIGVVVVMPVARPIFDDARVIDVGVAGAMYEMLLRIPVGTALFEEVLFRGLLLGWFMRLTSQARAVAASSLLFGLWHVLPTLAALDLYQAGVIRDAGSVGTAFAVVAGVALTAAFGIAMCGLRIGARSLAAPVTVHAVVNSFVYASFYFLAATV